MFLIPLATSGSFLSRDDFWKSLLIYHNRPHIVNRKIAVADQVLLHKVESSARDNFNISDILTTHGLAYEVQKLEEIDKDNIDQKFLMNLLDTYVDNVKLNEEDFDALQECENGVHLSLRIILPRMQKCSRCVELVVLDKNKDMATFFSTVVDKDRINPLPPFPYRIELTRENFMKLTLNEFEDADTSSAEWLFNSLFTKLMNWSTLSNENKTIGSLNKIPLQKYCHCYNNLKEKYGEPLRKVWWDITKTDPQKFIYEDIAIASYLICLWLEEYKTEATSFVEFVDCGCGNGLLVYILNKEGFRGHGIDIRRRIVWDLFADSAKLQVGTVGPDSRFPNATWLIGNHSDELTPWLPVIASKSSAATNYFVLPCCPYDFSGQKYTRRNTSISQYADYMEYIKEVSDICKFETFIDKLRIPSTKRTCLIGLRKNGSTQNISGICEQIDDYLKSKFDSSSCYFKARAPTERVRNCTQIDQKIKGKIVKEVVKCLLSSASYILKDDGTEWNKGGAIPLNELSKLLEKEDLNHLKKECGGLQTLLKNHRYIFKLDEGHVSLRLPYQLKETSKYKEKPCWFYRFHPQSCLYNNEICAYLHDQ